MRLSRPPALLRILVLAGVLLSVGAGAGTLASAAPARVAANTTTYQDSTGENPAAPDITTVVVSNNDAGMITFRINIPNRAQLDRDMLVDLFVDSDNNPATGDPELFGADYALELILGDIALFKWDGENFTRRPGDPPSTSLLYAYNGGVSINISSTELGNTKAFGFATIVLSGLVIDDVTGDIDFTKAVGDAAPAPDAGLFKFEVKTAPAKLEVQKVTHAPARPNAGKAFSLKMTVARSDTGAVLQGGRVTCVGRVGTARLRATTARVVNRVVTCTWTIPAKASGKTFRGSVTVVFEGLKATRSFSSKIG
jgi:hypothetical protein